MALCRRGERRRPWDRDRLLGRSRAFTIIEMLVVLVIMLAIAAVVFPLALDDARRAAFSEGKEQLEAAIISARADSQRTGKVIRVSAVEHQGQTVVVEEEVRDADVTGGLSSDESGAERPVRVLHETALPDGVRVGATIDAARGLAGDSGEPAATDPAPLAPATDPAAAPADGARVQVAMFLPDGQIVPTKPLYLGGPDGRVGELSVNSWTGTLELRVLPAQTSDSGDAGDVGGDEGTGTAIGGESGGRGEGGGGQER